MRGAADGVRGPVGLRSSRADRTHWKVLDQATPLQPGDVLIAPIGGETNSKAMAEMAGKFVIGVCKPAG